MKTYLVLLRLVLFVSFLISLSITVLFSLQNWKLNPIVPGITLVLFLVMALDAYKSRLWAKVNQ